MAMNIYRAYFCAVVAAVTAFQMWRWTKAENKKSKKMHKFPKHPFLNTNTKLYIASISSHQSCMFVNIRLRSENFRRKLKSRRRLTSAAMNSGRTQQKFWLRKMWRTLQRRFAQGLKTRKKIGNKNEKICAWHERKWVRHFNKLNALKTVHVRERHVWWSNSEKIPTLLKKERNEIKKILKKINRASWATIHEFAFWKSQ